MKRHPTTQTTIGTNAGTGLPNKSMMPSPPMNPNTAGPTASGHVDNFNADNGAVGANSMATPTANSGTTVGNALTQLLGTQNRDNTAYPTLSGGQFPPGAPSVSGQPNEMPLPGYMNSGGEATADSIQQLNYINSLPWNMPASIAGASVNGPVNLAEGPAQPGPQPQLGSILQGLYSPPGVKNAKAHVLNSQPQPPLNLSLAFPQSNLGGGLR